ncbi:endonuclease domain-containing protein [Blastococcus sp. SYSU D00922]
MPQPRRPVVRLTGPVTRSAARAAGMDDRQLREGGFVRLSRDTYVPRSLAEDVDARLAAVLMTAPAGSVASHRAAAAMWGIEIPLVDRTDRRVDLIAPGPGRAESRADRRLHRLSLADDECTHRRGQPVTTPARTWRDLAAVLEPPSLLAVTDQVIRGLAGAADLAAQLRRHPRGRGCARAGKVLPLADPRAESPMESVVRWLFHAGGLPAPELQYVVRDARGAFVARADFAWPAHRVLVEFDGEVHREREVFVKDLRRQNLVVASGWTILRYTSADALGRPDDLVSEVRSALRS